MFRKMRRAQQALTVEANEEILRRNTSGVLAVAGDDGYPYAVPLSYVYADGKVYFHCATTGHKLDAAVRCDKASFCVIDQDHVVPQEHTTYYRSVIAFGRLRVLTETAEKIRTLTMLDEKYYAPGGASRQHEIDTFLSAVCLLELTIEHLTGKESVELIRCRQAEQNSAADAAQPNL